MVDRVRDTRLDGTALEVDFSKVDFHEYYDVTTDPWQMNNLYNSTSPATLGKLHSKLRTYFQCAGDTCP